MNEENKEKDKEPEKCPLCGGTPKLFGGDAIVPACPSCGLSCLDVEITDAAAWENWRKLVSRFPARTLDVPAELRMQLSGETDETDIAKAAGGNPPYTALIGNVWVADDIRSGVADYYVFPPDELGDAIPGGYYCLTSEAAALLGDGAVAGDLASLARPVMVCTPAEIGNLPHYAVVVFARSCVLRLGISFKTPFADLRGVLCCRVPGKEYLDMVADRTGVAENLHSPCTKQEENKQKMNEENKEKGKDVSCVDRTTGLLIKKLLEAAPSQRFYHNGALHTLAPCSEPNFFRVEPGEAYLAGPEIVKYEFIAMADETYIAMPVEPPMDEKFASAVDKILGTPKEMREAERRAAADIALAKASETKPVKEETAPPMYTAAIATAEDAANPLYRVKSDYYVFLAHELSNVVRGRNYRLTEAAAAVVGSPLCCSGGLSTAVVISTPDEIGLRDGQSVTFSTAYSLECERVHGFTSDCVLGALPGTLCCSMRQVREGTDDELQSAVVVSEERPEPSPERKANQEYYVFLPDELYATIQERPYRLSPAAENLVGEQHPVLNPNGCIPVMTPGEVTDLDLKRPVTFSLGALRKVRKDILRRESFQGLQGVLCCPASAIRQNTQEQGTKACMSVQSLASYIDKVGAQSVGVEGKIDQDALGAKVLGKKIIFVPEFMLRDTVTLLQEPGKCLLNVDGVLEEFRRIPHVYFMTGTWAPEKRMERAFAFAESDDRVLCCSATDENGDARTFL